MSIENPKVLKDTGLNVFLLDPGGRGHAMAKELLESDRVTVLQTSIQATIQDTGGEKVKLYKNDSKDPVGNTLALSQISKPDLVLALPENPLSKGLTDKLNEAGIPSLGPLQEHTYLEGDKAAAKKFMLRWGVPVPEFKIFTDPSDAQKYICQRSEPLVVKASGLAAGKGSLVCDDQRQATEAVKTLMIDKIFGDAGSKIVVEDRLFGIEQSCTILTDGNDFTIMPTARDYKQRFDGNQGKNTGGMGSHSPSGNEDIFSESKVIERIVRPTLKGVVAETGKSYRGVLYAGLMWVFEGSEWNPYVLEFNIRPGDPEWQVIAPKLNGDWGEMLLSAVNGKLGEINPTWSDKNYLTVCAVSGEVSPGVIKGKGKYPGYPNRYLPGQQITFRGILPNEGYFLHSGTISINRDGKNEHFETSGGRVLCAVGSGEHLNQARSAAYQTLSGVVFNYMDYRKDIGEPVLLKEERQQNNTVR